MPQRLHGRDLHLDLGQPLIHPLDLHRERPNGLHGEAEPVRARDGDLSLIRVPVHLRLVDLDDEADQLVDHVGVLDGGKR